MEQQIRVANARRHRQRIMRRMVSPGSLAKERPFVQRLVLRNDSIRAEALRRELARPRRPCARAARDPTGSGSRFRPSATPGPADAGIPSRRPRPPPAIRRRSTPRPALRTPSPRAPTGRSFPATTATETDPRPTAGQRHPALRRSARPGPDTPSSSINCSARPNSGPSPTISSRAGTRARICANTRTTASTCLTGRRLEMMNHQPFARSGTSGRAAPDPACGDTRRDRRNSE